MAPTSGTKCILFRHIENFGDGRFNTLRWFVLSKFYLFCLFFVWRTKTNTILQFVVKKYRILCVFTSNHQMEIFVVAWRVSKNFLLFNLTYDYLSYYYQPASNSCD